MWSKGGGGGGTGAFQRRTQFDPWLIVAQICTLQCIFYLINGLFLVLIAALVSGSFGLLSLRVLLSAQSLSVGYSSGWIPIVTNVLTFPVSAYILSKIVAKAKKCLDFSATIYILHLVICTIYGGFPMNTAWWVVNILALIGTAVASEVLCMRQEMKDIPLDRR